MVTTDGKNGWLIVLLIVTSILFWKDHKELTRQVDDLKDEIYDLEFERDSYESALNQVNSYIEDAQWYAWSSYEDMGYALENLEPIYP